MSNSLIDQLRSISLEEIPQEEVKIIEVHTPLQLFVDGSANPNPGIITLGLILKFEKEIIWHDHFKAGFGTNNQAEFIAIIKGMELLKKVYKTSPELSNKPCTIISDSRLATNAILNVRPPKNDQLNNLYIQCINSMNISPRPTIIWQSRKNNSEADSLSRGYSVKLP